MQPFQMEMPSIYSRPELLITALGPDLGAATSKCAELFLGHRRSYIWCRELKAEPSQSLLFGVHRASPLPRGINTALFSSSLCPHCDPAHEPVQLLQVSL